MNKLLEISSTDFMFLWQTVNEDHPTIHKIFSGIKDAHKSITFCKDFWSKNYKYFRFMASIQEIYGRFLKDVLNQRKEGLELISEAVKSIKKKSVDTLLLKNISLETSMSGFPISCLILKKQANVKN